MGDGVNEFPSHAVALVVGVPALVILVGILVQSARKQIKRQKYWQKGPWCL